MLDLFMWSGMLGFGEYKFYIYFDLNFGFFGDLFLLIINNVNRKNKNNW